MDKLEALTEYKEQVGISKSLCECETYQGLCELMNRSAEKNGFPKTMDEFLLYFADMIIGMIKKEEEKNLTAIIARLNLVFEHGEYILIKKSKEI